MPQKGELSPLRDKAETLLKERNYTIYQLMEKMEVGYSCASWHMRRMKREKLIYIIDYDRRIGKGLGGSYTKIYAWGDESDAPPPKRDQKANNERHRAKRITLEKARRRAKMDPTNPFRLLICPLTSTHRPISEECLVSTGMQESDSSSIHPALSAVSSGPWRNTVLIKKLGANGLKGGTKKIRKNQKSSISAGMTGIRV